MITELRTAVYAIVITVVVIILLAVLTPSAGAQTPQQRCQPGALAAYATQPPTYARCVAGGFWQAISKKDYERLTVAAKRVRR